jgi:sugar/nucleoside kinase (ribokinase family)
MALLVVGSTAFDTIETPLGKRADCLGGSSTYFSLAASLFTEVRLVSVVGNDFPAQSRELLARRGTKLDGLEVKPGKTFRWSGRYSADMNSRETVDVQLNTFGGFAPKVPASFRDTPYVFLANGSPGTQASVLEQMKGPLFTVADTMDLWIENERSDLDELLRSVDGLIINDEEVKMLTGETNLIRAGRTLLGLGPKLAIVKKGEHGAFLFSNYFQQALPAYPTDQVVDPTGAGDSFAGGFMGFLADCDSLSLWNMKRAMAYGTVTASLTVEGFGVDRLASADRAAVERRYHELIQFVSI